MFVASMCFDVKGKGVFLLQIASEGFKELNV